MRLASILLVAASAMAQSPGTSNPDIAAATRVFTAWLEGQIAYRNLPGVAVGVVHGQALVWARGFGYSDLGSKAPVTPKTKFRMASHTKLFTATAVLQLRDEGKLRLDDTVARHLPWFRMNGATDDDGPVTIEHLLTHSSGLPREAASPYWSTFRFPTAEEVRGLIPAQQAAYSPDVRWKYSNLSYSLAGYIVEAASGASYAEYLRTRILDPLGMSDSSLDREVAGIAVGYGRRMPDGSRERMPFTDTKGIGPAAGLTSTVEDMARFVSLQFHTGAVGGKAILRGATLREMHRVRMLENNWLRGNGLGFAVTRDREKIYVGHGGSLAGYKTHTLIDVAGKTGVVVLTNGDDARPNQLAERLMQTVGAAVVKAAAPAPKAPLWDPSWSRYAGLYRSRWGDVEVVEGNRALTLVDPTADNPEPELSLAPLGGGQFKVDAPTGGGAIGEQAFFHEKDGKVTAIQIGQSIIERVNR